MLDKNKLPFSTQEARDYYESSKPYFTIVKTHQPPRCKVCKKPKLRLDQGTMLCDSCRDNEGKNLEKWL